MTMYKLPISLVMVIISCGIGLQLWYWPQLPEKMATHFDAAGNPNGWMDKLSATLLSTGLLIVLPSFFIGTAQAISRFPNSLINLPYREYWLAPERRNTSLLWMKSWMLWLSVEIAMFLLVLNHLTFVANRDAQSLSVIGFWALLGSFLFTTFAMVLLMFKRFYISSARSIQR